MYHPHSTVLHVPKKNGNVAVAPSNQPHHLFVQKRVFQPWDLDRLIEEPPTGPRGDSPGEPYAVTGCVDARCAEPMSWEGYKVEQAIRGV